MSAKPPYVHEERRAAGLRRRYWRRIGGKPFTRELPANVQFSDPRFMAAYARAHDEAEAAARGKPGPARGSVDAFVSRYLASPAFKELAENTQNARRNNLRRFSDMTTPAGKRVGGAQLRGMEQRHLRAILADLTPDSKRVMVQAIRAMIESAIDRGELVENVAAGFKVKLPKTKARKAGRHTWTAEEIAQYRAHHAPGSRARLALDVLLLTGQRRGDAVGMGWHLVKDRVLRVEQEKTGGTARIPVRDELAAVLADLPLGRPWLLNAHGAAWASGNAFGNQFADWCDAAGLASRCRAHGLRKAFCCHWAQKGYSAHQIATMSGHISLSEVERYTQEADRDLIVRAMLEG
jgi:integrase